MHTLKIRMTDSAYEKIQYILDNLPKEDVEVLSDDFESASSDKAINFADFNINSYKSIEDPLKWQKSIREEWDR